MQVSACPGCNAQYNTAQMTAGQQFQCTNCGTLVTVGAQAQAPQRMPQRTGPAAGRPMPGGQRQMPGGPRGQMQPPMGGRQMPGAYGAPQKKGGGAVIGIIIGVVVLVAIIVGVMVASGGKSELMPADQALVDRLLTFSNENRVLFEPTELERLKDLVNTGAIGPDQAEMARQRLPQARDHRESVILKASNDKYLDFQKRAREAALKVANEFYTAMKNGDAATLKGMIDWDTYSAALENRGILKKIYSSKDEAAYNSPSSHELALDQDPQTKGYKVRAVRQYSIPEMQTKGLNYLISLYKKPDLRYIWETDKGVDAVYNLPPGLENISDRAPDMVSDYWYMGMQLEFPKNSKAEANKAGRLRVLIGGKWGDNSAKVLAIADRTTGLWGETKWNDVKYEESLTMGDGDRNSGMRDPIDGGTTSKVPSPIPYNGGVPENTSVRPSATSKLDIHIDTAFKGSSVGRNGIEDFDKASNADRMKMIAYASEKILQAMAQGESRVASCIQQIAEYVSDCIREWDAMKEYDSWKNSISFVRPEQSLEMAKQIAYQYQQFYKTLKDHVK